jgi:hypothetical protein
MFISGIDANEITMEDIEDFLNSDGAATSTANDAENDTASTENPPATQPNGNANTQSVTETQAFAHRLKEATSKARNDERENIAKSFGYESYAEMQKAREQSLLRDKGLDPEDATPIIEEIVKRRLAEDPRLKELESLEQERRNNWAKKELDELRELTGGRISKIEDVPKEVLELWKTKGSLKGAYIELHGEKLIREMQSGIAREQSKGSTDHLNAPQGTPPASTNSNKRPFTQKEREIYKLFNPDVTDEELSKMMKDK